MKVNLGCGKDYKEGWINVDFNKNVKADIYCDFSKKLPFKNNSVDYLVASYCLEHLIYPEIVLREIERVSKTNGTVEIFLPHFNWLDHHRDLTHRFFATSQTFCEEVQTISYQTHFEVLEISFCCKFHTIVKYFGLRFLELINYPIYSMIWKLKVKK